MNATQTTSVTATVERMIYNYPSLFANRTQALRHLLCVPGNGYEWEDGQLVSVFVEPNRTDEDVQWQAPDWATPETVAEYAERNARWLEIRRNAAELARTAGPLERSTLEIGNSLLPRPLPDDATQEWRDAAVEYEATVRELHSWWVS